MEIQEKSKTNKEKVKKVNTSQINKPKEEIEVPKIMTAIAALTIRELVNLANEYGIKREDVITIVKDNGQYVLIHYSPSI